MEALAAAELPRDQTDVSVRVVSVVELLSLQTDETHPRGLTKEAYDERFPPGIPTIFAFHGHPWLVHRLAYNRANDEDLHVHGYIEEGSTTTPFDMVVRNRLDRFHLALAAIDRLPEVRQERLKPFRRHLLDRLRDHQTYVVEHGEDLPEIHEWTYSR